MSNSPTGRNSPTKFEADLPEKERPVATADAKLPFKILFYMFEDAGFFEKGVFGNGKGHSNKKGAPLKLASLCVIHTINTLIITSTIAVSMATVPQFSTDPHQNPENWRVWESRWDGLEILCVVAFSIDLVIRFGGSLAAGPHEAKTFFTDWMNLVDVVAIAPFYIGLFTQTWDLRFLRVVRLVRVLKTLPGAKNGDMIGLITNIIKDSGTALMVPLFFAFLALVVLSAMTWSIEKTQYLVCAMGDGTVVYGWVPAQDAVGYYDDAGDGIWLGETHPDVEAFIADGAPQTLYNQGCLSDYGCACPGTISYVTKDGTVWSSELFSSIPDVFWWCIVSFTTVGYGDVNPRTAQGQCLCALTMFVGIFFLAMPISIVGDAFQTNWNRFTAKRFSNEARAKHNKEAEAKQAARARGQVIHVELDGPYDVLNDDICGFMRKALVNLKTKAPADQDDKAVWDEAAGDMEKCKEMWDTLYTKIMADIA